MYTESDFILLKELKIGDTISTVDRTPYRRTWKNSPWRIYRGENRLKSVLLALNIFEFFLDKKPVTELDLALIGIRNLGETYSSDDGVREIVERVEKLMENRRNTDIEYTMNPTDFIPPSASDDTNDNYSWSNRWLNHN